MPLADLPTTMPASLGFLPSSRARVAVLESFVFGGKVHIPSWAVGFADREGITTPIGELGADMFTVSDAATGEVLDSSGIDANNVAETANTISDAKESYEGIRILATGVWRGQGVAGLQGVEVLQEEEEAKLASRGTIVLVKKMLQLPASSVVTVIAGTPSLTRMTTSQVQGSEQYLAVAQDFTEPAVMETPAGPEREYEAVAAGVEKALDENIQSVKVSLRWQGNVDLDTGVVCFHGAKIRSTCWYKDKYVEEGNVELLSDVRSGGSSAEELRLNLAAMDSHVTTAVVYLCCYDDGATFASATGACRPVAALCLQLATHPPPAPVLCVAWWRGGKRGEAGGVPGAPTGCRRGCVDGWRGRGVGAGGCWLGVVAQAARFHEVCVCGGGRCLGGGADTVRDRAVSFGTHTRPAPSASHQAR